MTNTDKPYNTPTLKTAESPDESTYIVAVNDQGQHAAWPAQLALPAGWQQQPAAMPKRACLAAIAAAWEDIAPVSVRAAKPKARDCPVAFCADLSPDSVLSAYQRGIFPFPAPDEYTRDINEFQYEDRVSDGAIGLVGGTDDDPYWVAWWSPDPRPVIKVGNIHLGRNVRKQLRRGQTRTTANDSFLRVAEECRAGREPRWLTDTLLDSMASLHEQGWAHSIEVWQDSELIGGAIGIGVGVVLSGDSMFSRRPDAARIAVADMAARFAQAGGALIDAQWDSPFLRSLGAELMPRDDYLPLLAGSAERRVLPDQPLLARRLTS